MPNPLFRIPNFMSSVSICVTRSLKRGLVKRSSQNSFGFEGLFMSFTGQYPFKGLAELSWVHRVGKICIALYGLHLNAE